MNKGLIRKGLVFGLIVLFVGINVIPSTVGINKEKTPIQIIGSRGYIQDLIDNASDGDTIYIPSGTYYVDECIIIDKSVSLVGENKDTTIIVGSWYMDLIYVTSDWVNISGFTLNYAIRGIYIESNFNTINDNKLYGFMSSIYLKNSFYNKINNNIISDNLLEGLYLDNSNNNTIVNNYFYKNDGYGILLEFSINNLIKGNNFSYNDAVYSGAIVLTNSPNNFIIDNIISNNWAGIHLLSSSFCFLRNNIMVSNHYNLGVFGDIFKNYIQDIDVSNTIDEKPVYFWYDIDDAEVPSDVGYIALINCTNINVNNLTLKNNYQGILLVDTYYSIIIDNNISGGGSVWGFGGGAGIDFYFSGNNTIKRNSFHGGVGIKNSNYNSIIDNNFLAIGTGIGGGSNNLIEGNYISSQYGISSVSNSMIKNNNITNNQYGIYRCNDCSIFRNNIKNNHNGIQIGNDLIIEDNNISYNEKYGIRIDSDNHIIGNTISKNERGVEFGFYNIFKQNNVTFNTEYGIFLYNSQYNRIYHNNFINNTDNRGGESNDFDYGKEGNYWSDYRERYPDAKPKKLKPWIWDIPYEFNYSAIDNYPLLNRWPKSRSRTLPRTQIIVHPIFNWFLERFPLLERLLNIIF